eukprot:UN06599
MSGESMEVRLYLAQFLEWRCANLEGLDLDKEHRVVTNLLNFSLKDQDDADIGEWIRIKFDLAFQMKSIVELNKLRLFLKKNAPAPKAIKKLAHTQYHQISFKLACIFGVWDDVMKFGKIVHELSRVIKDPYTGQDRQMSLFQLFGQLAQRKPDQNPNYLTFYIVNSL